MKRVVVSAPGKCILMGEHAAVYGSPALVAAIDQRLTASLRTVPGRDDLRLLLPQLGVDEVVPWQQLADYAAYCGRAWQAWSESPSSEGLSQIAGGDPAHVVKLAAGLAFGTSLDGSGPPPGAELTVQSDIPLGSGFGSSAAAAVAVVQAVLVFRGQNPSLELLHRLSLEVERCQHGSPSGVDNATVIHGGVLWAERRDGELTTTPLEHLNHRLLGSLRVLHSGQPGETTGEVVAAVRRRRDRDPAGFDKALTQAGEMTRALRQHLEQETGEEIGPASDLVRRYESWLETCGVVPPSVSELIRKIEARGGAAKISGAGSLAGPGAGSLLVLHQDPNEVDSWDFLDSCQRLDVDLGAAGSRVEVT